MTDLLTSAAHGLATLTLNRPEALHALTTHMCRNMTQALLAYRDDPEIKVVIIDHAPGTRGFCAGGDIRMIQESGKGDGAAARDFFFTEYRLNHLLFTYPKPVIALMDGITMGGGVGISMPAKFRVATERTTFAMPETGIGLFPDVGGGWYLPRLPSQIGLWLALTGARLKGADCYAADIATHYAPSEKLDAVRHLAAAVAEAEHTLKLLEEGLDEIDVNPGDPVELSPENHARIDKLFSGETVEAIFSALGEENSDWSKAQLAALETKSPQTLKVALRQLREGAHMKDFAEEMRHEYRIACRVSRRHDFIEGVRALIIDKDNAPRWDPPSLAAVTDAMLDEIFAPLPPEGEWSPLP
ncbi:MAG: enoyl-CoA hydratase/isomerase family protein [Hyphomonadaceae bacterium]